MSEKSRIETRKKQLLAYIDGLGYPPWMKQDFQYILQDYIIKNTLEVAYNETAKRTYLNRHGVEHGLNVAYFAGHLFWLIHNDYISSDYAIDYGFKKEEVLFVLLTAGYIHDCGRFYDQEIKNHEERIAETLRHIYYAAGNSAILPHTDGQKKELMLAKIAELCLCHDKKRSTSGKSEIAIIKLADALDCDQNRVYNAEDKPESLGRLTEEDYPEIIKNIVYNDEKPERYFGPKSVKKISLDTKETEGLVEVTIKIADTAAYGEIKDSMRVLELCKNSQSKSARDFANRVRVRIIDPAFKRPFPLYPRNPVFLPGACIARFGYDVDIINMNGDSSVQTPLFVKNKSNSGGLSSHVAMLGGLIPIPWENIEKKEFYEVKKNFNSLGEVKSEDLVKLSLEYLYSEKSGINHYFNVIFPRKIKRGENINLLGVFKWNRLVNVFDDSCTHTIATPTDDLFFRILFPKEIEPGAFIESSFKISDREGKTVSIEQISPSATDGRTCLQKEVKGATSTGNAYTVHWEVKKI